jgi:hypothetical protein
MNASRIAQLFRDLADAFLDREEHREPAQTSRRSRTVVRPAGESDDLARAAARRALRDYGFLKGKQ